MPSQPSNSVELVPAGATLATYWMRRDFELGLCSESDLGKPIRASQMARRLAQLATPVAIRALIDVATLSRDHKARVNAALALLERGWGKPEEMPPDDLDADEWPEWLTQRRHAYQEPGFEPAPACEAPSEAPDPPQALPEPQNTLQAPREQPAEPRLRVVEAQPRFWDSPTRPSN